MVVSGPLRRGERPAGADLPGRCRGHSADSPADSTAPGLGVGREAGRIESRIDAHTSLDVGLA